MSVQDPDSSMESDTKALAGPLVVAVGASAGGLEALSDLLRAAPEGTGMAFLVVQHLSPDHKSMMPELLQRQTDLVVQPAEDGAQLAADHVYVIEPQTTLELDLSGTLRVRHAEARARMRIDTLFASVAESRPHRCVAIVLSGTGSDGTIGIEAVKQAGGVVVVQEPATAGFDGMPRSALRTGLADLVLPPELMVQELMDMERVDPAEFFGLGGEHGELVLGRILLALHKHCGIDFTHYKPATIVRRINRRMGLIGERDARAYARTVHDDRIEAAALHRDLPEHVGAEPDHPHVLGLAHRPRHPVAGLERDRGAAQ